MRHLFFLLFTLVPATFCAQRVQLLPQRALSHWGIGAASFSGITPLGGARYALVSDREPADGYFRLHIAQDSLTGRITHVALEGFYGVAPAQVDAQGMSQRDAEDIAFCPDRGTLFIAAEGDQRIAEYTLDGAPTDQELRVPSRFSRARIVPNYGFEALAYDAPRRRFFFTTESTLPADSAAASPQHPQAVNLLRIAQCAANLQPEAMYAYRMDSGRARRYGRIYAFGVSAMAALPSGELLVLEREANVPARYLGASVRCKLYLVAPDRSVRIDEATALSALPPEHFMQKRLLADFTTRLSPVSLTFANYEGMCLGRRLADGRQTLLLVSDAQGGAGRAGVHLKSYLKVLVLDP